MPIIDEKQEFSQRLKQALTRAPKKVDTAAKLADQFNLRYEGEPVTQQAAQKWLAGTARPTADKIETLAEWLNVPALWLRHGVADNRPMTNAARKSPKGKSSAVIPTDDELKLLGKLRSLPEHHRNLVTEIIEAVSLEREMWRE